MRAGTLSPVARLLAVLHLRASCLLGALAKSGALLRGDAREARCTARWAKRDCCDCKERDCGNACESSPRRG